MSDSDDDVPQLSAETLAALQEFYAEQMNEAGQEQAVLTDKYTVGALEEDWVHACLSSMAFCVVFKHSKRS